VAEVNVVAMQYESGKMGKTFEAWRYQPTGWSFPSWFDAEGKEVPLRLENAPIADYEQITSLIGDGRGHSGMDFKTPAGTEIRSPWDGTVERTNWNWRNNGNCVELQTGKGKVRFLHMSEIKDGIGPGSRLKAGDVVGLTGNTGRSFAPHLHYELVDGAGRVLDPLKVHKTSRRSLEPGELPRFQAERDRLLAQMAMLDVAPAEQSTPAP
jgi:murein DD-endopeptidase MepM/ murein hydrolase activator NlpD